MKLFHIENLLNVCVCVNTVYEVAYFMCKRKGVKNEWVNNVIIRFFGKKKRLSLSWCLWYIYIFYISGEWSKNIIFVVKKRFCHQQHGNNFEAAYKIPNMPHTWISLCFSLFMIYFFIQFSMFHILLEDFFYIG